MFAFLFADSKFYEATILVGAVNVGLGVSTILFLDISLESPGAAW